DKQVGPLSNLDRSVLTLDAGGLRRRQRAHSYRFMHRNSEADHIIHRLPHRDDGAGYSRLTSLAGSDQTGSAVTHRDLVPPDREHSVAETRRRNSIADQGQMLRSLCLIHQAQHQRIDVMEIGYAVHRYIVANQPPRHGARLAMMQRLERIREMGHVSRAGFYRLVKCGGVGLGVAYESARSAAREFGNET